jgi:hypothetical protein
MISVLAATWALAMLTPAGQVLYVYMYYFVEFYAGVVTLVSMSLTVMAGLVATDRIVLLVRHRVLLQSVHRATGIIAVSGLVLHVVLKISVGRAAPIDAVVPFVSGRGLYVGLGSVAAYLLVSVLWVGLIRARFVGVGKPWMWRALHSTAYISWPVALVHGLNSGRPPATWVTLSYLLCVLLVLIALLVRLSVSLGRKRQEQGGTTGTMKPVGKMKKDDAESRNPRAGAAARRRGTDILAGREPSKSVRPSPSALADPVVDSWTRTGEFETAYAPQRGSDRFVVPEVVRARSEERPVEDRPRSGRDRAPMDDARDQVRSPSADDRSAVYRPRRSADDAPPADRSRDDQWGEGSRHWAADDPEPEGDLRDGYRESYRDSYRETSRETSHEPSRRRPLDDDGDGASPRRRFGRHGRDEGPALDRDYPPERDYPRERDRDYPPERDYPRDRDRDRDYPPERDYPRDRDRDRDYPPERAVARYAIEPPPVPIDDTPTLVDLASRRAIRAAAEEESASGRSSRRKRSSADTVDEAYWRDLRGEAK